MNESSSSKKYLSLLFATLLGLAATLSLSACGGNDGPAENAGQQIDEAAENAGQQLDEAAENAANSAEQAQDEAEEAVNDAQN